MLPSPGFTGSTSASAFEKVLFRFIFSYVIFRFATSESLVHWVGKHILALPGRISTQMTGSGDTLFHWVSFFTHASLAFAITLAWTLFAKKEANYPRLKAWLRILLRYWLAAIMLNYGLAKLVPVGQFASPQPFIWMKPLSEMSPMNLLWTFMGFSPVYSAFAGFSELLGGLLLLFRRTTTFGALVVLTVMSNVVMLNFCYDVPVKLYSLHLLTAAALLILPQSRRLFDFFAGGRAVEALDDPYPFQHRWLKILRKALKPLVLALVLWSVGISMQQWLDPPRQSKPEGLWKVSSFSQRSLKDGKPAPGAEEWRHVGFGTYLASVWIADASHQYYGIRYKPEHRSWAGTMIMEGNGTYEFSVDESRPGVMMLEGQSRKWRIIAELTRVPAEKTQLFGRGFHWVQEYPFNR